MKMIKISRREFMDILTFYGSSNLVIKYSSKNYNNNYEQCNFDYYYIY